MILSQHGIIDGIGRGGCAPIVGTEITVINGTGTVLHYEPYTAYYRYSLGIFLVTASELGSAKQLTGLQLSKAYTEPSGITQLNNTIKIYHTTSSILPSTINTSGSGANMTLNGVNAFLPVSDETEVLYNTSFYQTASSGWKTINFPTNNFCYNGVDNVVVMWVNNMGAYDISNYPYWDTDSTASSNSRGGYSYSDSSLPTSVSRVNSRPHLKFNY